MRILFLGTPEIAAIALDRVAHAPQITLVGIVTQPDRPSGRGRALQPPPVKQRALDLGLRVPILQPETLRDPQVVAEIGALAPDVGIVAAYGEILRRDMLRLPPAGYLNIHPSLLPRHRGPAPVTGAILAGDAEVGVSVMRLTPRMDAGPLLAQHREPLPDDARAGELTARLFGVGAQLLLDVLPAYLDGTLEAIPQDEALATYTSLIQKQDGTIDWSLPAAQIERMTRAYDPWPGAQTLIRRQPLRIIAAQVVPETQDLPPGSLIERNARLYVATGAGALELVTVQPAGKRPLAAIEWRRGLRDVAGVRLGDNGW
jgi:methionyl-tRNA formyltransferase